MKFVKPEVKVKAKYTASASACCTKFYEHTCGITYRMNS